MTVSAHSADISALVSEDRAAPFDRSRPLPEPLRPKARLSVLDVTKYFGDTTGGIRTYLLEKARYVAAHPEVRHTMIVPGPRDSVAEIDGVRCYRLRNVNIPTQRPYRFLLNTSLIERVLERERPDLIEIGSPLLVPWVMRRANRRHRIPMVWFFHSNLPLVVNQIGPRVGRGLAARVARAYTRRVGSLCRATIATSEASARDLEAYGVSPVIRASLGVDLERFSPLVRERALEIRSAAGLPAGPLAIYAGRLAVEKQLDVLLDAWARVERRTGARLVVVGDGAVREKLQRHPYAPRVAWLPFQQDRGAVAELLAAGDLFVTPSATETFGFAALEAMASGVPVLGAASGAVAEFVEASGAGRTFAGGDSGDLAEQAVWLLGQDLPALGKRGRAYAERHHSWPGVFDRLFAVYREVVAA
jgi:alpha-1,6-mannosyltransferase